MIDSSKSIFSIIFIATLTSCGAATKHQEAASSFKSTQSAPAVVSSTKDSTALESIGRGAKLTLTKDIEIPANMFMGVLAIETTYIRSSNDLYHYTAVSIQCGVTAKEKSLDRRVVPAGTAVELSGQWWRDPNGDINSPYLRENLGVAKPGEISAVTCLAYAKLCDSQSGICSAYYQPKMTIADLKSGFRSVGIIEQASPVIIK